MTKTDLPARLLAGADYLEGEGDIGMPMLLREAAAELAKAREALDTQRQSKEYAQRFCNEAEAELAKAREEIAGCHNSYKIAHAELAKAREALAKIAYGRSETFAKNPQTMSFAEAREIARAAHDQVPIRAALAAKPEETP